jgi:cytochrome d ubiquinol oxidase subunit I
MNLTPLLLSRLQFAFTISYHIIFPSFSIGIAAWLVVLEGLHLATDRPVYRRLFSFWLKIFGLAFGLGVVSGVVMAFEFGTNWSRMSEATGPIQGPLLAYESFTAFALEASFFGVLIFGRGRVSRGFYFCSVAMVAFGTTLSAFWIMVNNSWMQAPVGYAVVDGMYVPTDWSKIIFNPVLWVRFPHMLLASYLAGAFCVAATGAWYRLRETYAVEGKAMLKAGLVLASVLIPVQLFIGHLNGDYVHDVQPIKFAAIEARWHDEQPASEVIIGFPDAQTATNYLAIKIPIMGSLIATMTTDSKEIGLTDFPRQDWPPVAIPFFSFRIMVGCGLLMMAVAWLGTLMMVRDRLDQSRLILWAIFLSFPLPFIAILTGWFTAEVGRQPWTVYGLLRTADAVTPTLTAEESVISLAMFVCVHLLIFSFGAFYIYRLLRAGPVEAVPAATPGANRPLSLSMAAGQPQTRADVP